MTRSAVSMIGRGASVASNPTAHATHNSTAPATRGPSDHDASEADAPGPAVTGRVTHATRSSHRKTGRGSGTPFVPFGSSFREEARARLEHAAEAIVEYGLMSPTLRAPVLVPGVATGIGSLPHADPDTAAELVLRCLPELPAVPQLPGRDPREGMLAQWLVALPEVEVAPDGSLTLLGDSDAAPECVFDERAHSGLLAFVEHASRAERPPVRVKAQVTGPLTLGTALHAAGMPAPRAFRRAAAVTRAWSVAIEQLVDARLPDTGLVLFLDEPSLVVVATRRRTARSRGRDRRVVRCPRRGRQHDRRARVRRRRPRAGARSRTRSARGRGERRPGAAHGRPGALPRRRRLDRVGRGADGSSGRRVGRSALARARRACGASSRGAAATRCRCAHAG